MKCTLNLRMYPHYCQYKIQFGSIFNFRFHFINNDEYLQSQCGYSQKENRFRIRSNGLLVVKLYHYILIKHLFNAITLNNREVRFTWLEVLNSEITIFYPSMITKDGE